MVPDGIKTYVYQQNLCYFHSKKGKLEMKAKSRKARRTNLLYRRFRGREQALEYMSWVDEIAEYLLTKEENAFLSHSFGLLHFSVVPFVLTNFAQC